MNKILLMITVFSLGYVANDVVKEINVNPISNVNADIKGMSWHDFTFNSNFNDAVEHVIKSYGWRSLAVQDPDFRYAVEYVVDESYIESVLEDCSVSGENIRC